MTVPTLEKTKDPIPKVKQAGEGAVTATNPFESWKLPELTEEEFGAAANAAPGAPGGKSRAKELLDFGKKFVGTPYKWGGTGPLGFDCSGFVQYVYRKFGVELPRVSYQQAKYGKRVGLNELRPGDLVAWDTSARNNGADHIALYLGDGLVIHAQKPGDRVNISKLWDTGRAWGVSMGL